MPTSPPPLDHPWLRPWIRIYIYICCAVVTVSQGIIIIFSGAELPPRPPPLRFASLEKSPLDINACTRAARGIVYVRACLLADGEIKIRRLLYRTTV